MQLFNPNCLEVEEWKSVRLPQCTPPPASRLQALVQTSWIGPFECNGHTEKFWVYGRSGTVKAFRDLRFELPGLHDRNNAAHEWRIMQVSTPNFVRYQYKQMIDELVRCVAQGSGSGPKATTGSVRLKRRWPSTRPAEGRRAVVLPLAQEPDAHAPTGTCHPLTWTLLTPVHSNRTIGLYTACLSSVVVADIVANSQTN